MSAPSVGIVIDAAGEVTIEARGFVGTGCEEATRFLEEALGETLARTRKPEFYRNNFRRTRRDQRLEGSAR